ncbi:tat pathway signal sequence [Paraphaeosphaeria sporulosa]|uniref:Tat pathway signal sequence n=1 Tax=Paraphaeosphaeria sporulosa TaxID=1460663 RepID=A0A177CP39_9PLEO|nr:tat pathway signal sequence [Paraphaeosphaeria sporulosa]OAG09274.1 tat pathway signal sequence [Paraphaeosphaeria sporulosa]
MAKQPPAEDVIEYKTVEFVTNLHADMAHAEKNIYLELTDEGDAAWDLLTETYATSAIAPSLAQRLNEPTSPSPNEPDRYLVGLSVFHQLHCLSRIRRLLHPDRYPRSYFNLSAAETAVHDAHCVDLIRQTLMCHADISPVTWEWNERMGMALPSAKTMHVCRRWEPIWEWAVEHRAVGM